MKFREGLAVKMAGTIGDCRRGPRLGVIQRPPAGIAAEKFQRCRFWFSASHLNENASNFAAKSVMMCERSRRSHVKFSEYPPLWQRPLPPVKHQFLRIAGARAYFTRTTPAIGAKSTCSSVANIRPS